MTSSGQTYSCGIGQGGKLGLGSEATVISPQKINLEADAKLNNKLKKSTAILQAAIGTYHTILLTEGGNVSYRLLILTNVHFFVILSKCLYKLI